MNSIVSLDPSPRRGEVFDARLDPTEGSAQAGTRRIMIVSRDIINAASRVVLAVPCTTYRGQRIYPSQVHLRAPDGETAVDSVALGEKARALAETRLLRRRGALPPHVVRQIDRALLIAFDLTNAR